jgi:hypothetical protein
VEYEKTLAEQAGLEVTLQTCTQKLRESVLATLMISRDFPNSHHENVGRVPLLGHSRFLSSAFQFNHPPIRCQIVQVPQHRKITHKKNTSE